MTEHDMYMNGRGVMKRTRELNDKMWDAVLGSIFGSALAICVPLFCIFIAAIATGLSWTTLGLMFLVSLASIAVGVHMMRPWYRARDAVREHREAMEAETAKRGKGWASS